MISLSVPYSFRHSHEAPPNPAFYDSPWLVYFKEKIDPTMTRTEKLVRSRSFELYASFVKIIRCPPAQAERRGESWQLSPVHNRWIGNLSSSCRSLGTPSQRSVASSDSMFMPNDLTCRLFRRLLG